MVREVTDDDIGLRVLWTPNEERVNQDGINVDIVAIHGIGSHPDDTWCKNVGTKESPRWVNWLSNDTMLPAVVPNARILRYGYQSQWFGDGAMRQNASTVAGRLLLALRRERKVDPNRPLLFIAHCFGGLVVLKALLEAQFHNAEWPGIFRATAGLVFFGTPFRGAKGLSQVEMLDAARREYDDDNIQTDVLKVLEPGNEFLQELVDAFGKTRVHADKAQVACFYELKASDVGAIVGKQRRTRFVVNRDSGCLDISESTEKYSLSRTHFNMNQFGHANEEDFLTVREVLEEMVHAALNRQMHTDADSAAGGRRSNKYHVRFSLHGVPAVKKFIDRPAEMKRMQEVLLPNTRDKRRKISVLRGLGGIGKTQLAIEFVKRYHANYSAVLWLDGSSEDNLKQSLARCAGKLPSSQVSEASIAYTTSGEGDINAVVQEMLRWLAQEDNDRWLLIFDNVDREYNSSGSDPLAYDIKLYFPETYHGSILITSRLARLEQLGASQEVKKVDRKTAQTILESWYKGTYDEADGDRLFELLDGLPLAIAQAGAYLKESGVGVKKYLSFYEKQWDRLASSLDAKRGPLEDYPNRSVWTTWTISYEAIYGRDKHIAHLLLLWSFR